MSEISSAVSASPDLAQFVADAARVTTRVTAGVQGRTDDDGRRNLIGLTRAQLTELFREIGEPAFRVKQLWHWIYHRGETDFNAMTSISKKLRAKLEQDYVVARPKVILDQLSRDATHKWLMRFPDGNEAETVYIPDPQQDRGAVCMSSQVGCTLTCRFCHTGTQLLVRNLSPGEMVGQFMVARDSYREWPSPSNGTRLLSNIVMMGMGEPLFNYENVRDALRIVMDGEGLSLSKRRIILSTSGVVPEILRCGEELGVGLAISLHAPDDDLRSQIMPINKKYPLKELMDACRNYPAASPSRPITMEYVMLKGVNDSPAHARALVGLVKGIPCKFNLIPFNKWPGSDYECTPMPRIRKFATVLMENGVEAPIRMPRGRDILAACGQLKSESERKRKAKNCGNASGTVEDSFKARAIGR